MKTIDDILEKYPRIPEGHGWYYEDVWKAMEKYAAQFKQPPLTDEEIEEKNLTIPFVMPRILHFTDENGNNVDLNAAGINIRLLRDGTLEYFRSYGFAGRKELIPVYGA